MDRVIVYPGGIPLDTDLLAINRNTMIALGYLAQMVLGSNTVVDGLSCTATAPSSMTISVSPGSITQMSVIDASAYGSLAADTTDPLVKIGINVNPIQFTLQAPATPGQTIAYLIEATFQEADTNLLTLPYYNAANPAQPYTGPNNTGQAQATRRAQTVQLQLKAGTPAATGSQVPPAPDTGWVSLYVVNVSYGQTVIDQSSIIVSPSSPALQWKLPALRPGFGSGVQSFTASGTFVVPTGVSQVEVELWGGGSGSFASAAGVASGGGSGGGYARKRITGLTQGQQIAISVGAGGTAGGVGGPAPSAGGTSSFGSLVSATGGSLNYLATTSSPQNGATPPGIGVGGDTLLSGSAGQAGSGSQGGLGGAGAMGGTQNSGTTGVAGLFPGGGASGAGTGANGSTPYAGAAGAGGLVVVRW
jgi:hypothetical protein